MAYSKGTNTANFNNCSDWNSQNGNVTAVGRNGGPSAYGTYDQAGNAAEWVDNFYVLGGSYASSGSLLSINNPLTRVSSGTRNDSTGFRISGSDYTNVYITFSNPSVYTAGQPITHSFSIINEDDIAVPIVLSTTFSKNISSVAWTAVYPSGSSGPASGSISPSGSIIIGPKSTVVINLVSQTSAITKSNAILLANISLANTSFSPLIVSTFSSEVLIKSNSALTYQSIFSSFDWSPATPNSFLLIGDPNNLSDSTWGSFLGAVNYSYLMTKYEITNIEYCYFLNSVDPQGLNPQNIYDSNMGSTTLGGILFNSANPNGNKYTIKPRMGNKPINYVDWWCAARFCNWLHNGATQYATTDSTTNAPQNTGSYNLGTSTTGNTRAPNTNALFTIPTYNEWIKAAHYKSSNTNASYWNYATRSDFEPSGVLANVVTGNGNSDISYNSANIKSVASWDPTTGSFNTRTGPTTVGTNGVSSPYGLFDMLGNVSEITVSDNVAGAGLRARGGDYSSFWYYTFDLQYQNVYQPTIISSTRSSSTGFRIVSVIKGDMSISISASETNYTQGEDISVTVNVVNQSNHTISNNLLAVNIFGPTFQSTSWIANYPIDSFGPVSGTSSNINENISIGPNETVSVVFTVKPSALDITPITVNASITPNSIFADINGANNSSSLVIPVKPTDLAVTISGPEIYAQSVPLVYTMVVKNLSTTYVSGVDVGLTTSGATLSNFNWTAVYSLSSGALSGTNSPLSTQLAIFPSGEAIYTINITPSTTSINNLSLIATANTPSAINISDSNLSNNTGVLSASVTPTDISTQILLPQYYTQNVPYNINVSIFNTGQFSPSGTLNVIFSGVPQSSILWSGIYSIGAVGPTSGTGNIISSVLSIPNGGSAAYNISCTPPVNTLAPISCVVSAATRSPLTDSQLANNTVSGSTVLSPSDISISSSGIQYYENNGAIDYSFTIVNNSPNSINGILLNIPEPANVSNQRWLASYNGGSGVLSGSGTINTSIYLASSGSATFAFDATTNQGFITPISCTGLVSLPNISGVIDPILSNNASILSIPHALLIQDVKASASTCDNNGSITVVVNGGIPPFRYALGSIFANSSDRTYRFDGLAPGTYNITAIDSANYIAFLEEDIVIQDSNVSFTLNNIYPPTLLDSFAKIDFNVFGDGPFSLIFTNNETLETIEVSAFETKYIYDIVDNDYRYIINDLITPGSYTLSIFNKDKCSITTNIIVPNISPISVNVSVIPDEPININSPTVSLSIYDTLLIPYHHIQNNSSLWNLIKDFNIKDNIYLWINNERYEYRVVRTMLDKYCLNENKIEILKLGNSYEDWYFYLYIAPSINLSANPELISSEIFVGTEDGTEKYTVVLGLDDDGRLEQNMPSLIRGSIIVDGIAFPDIISGLTANLSIGVNEVGLASNNFELKNIHKTHLTNIYTAGVVTAINFLENFNVLNEYVNINQTTCNTSQQDYEYLINIKNVLLTINNINNIDNIYLFNNNNTIHTGQINCFASINTPMVTELGNIDNNYTTEYFTFNRNSDHIAKFIVNNNELKNVGVISGIDSRYIIARITDNYNNKPKSIIYENGTTITYDEHFIKSQQIIQFVNQNILHDFMYGDILIYVPPIQVVDGSEPDPSPIPPNPTPPTPTPTPVQNTPIIEMSKDSTNTGSLQINVFPLNTKCILYGPQKYEQAFIGAVVFVNLIPGVYKIVGDIEDLRNKNLYQNEYRIILDKNSITAQTVEFFSYANKLFISEKDH